uniref:Pco060326 n=1 Tax=Arundo donax TaxID=35708 RepID=A0A0A9CHU6_ARUDO
MWVNLLRLMLSLMAQFLKDLDCQAQPRLYVRQQLLSWEFSRKISQRKKLLNSLVCLSATLEHSLEAWIRLYLSWQNLDLLS